MLVIYLDEIEDFVRFLDRRSMNEIFYEINPDMNSASIALHFLGQVGEMIVLYETRLEVRAGKQTEEVLKEIQETFNTIGEIELIKGKIREIFISLA
jgi:hypothetical protein